MENRNLIKEVEDQALVASNLVIDINKIWNEVTALNIKEGKKVKEVIKKSHDIHVVFYNFFLDVFQLCHNCSAFFESVAFEMGIAKEKQFFDRYVIQGIENSTKNFIKMLRESKKKGYDNHCKIVECSNSFSAEEAIFKKKSSSLQSIGVGSLAGFMVNLVGNILDLEAAAAKFENRMEFLVNNTQNYSLKVEKCNRYSSDGADDKEFDPIRVKYLADDMITCSNKLKKDFDTMGKKGFS